MNFGAARVKKEDDRGTSVNCAGLNDNCSEASRAPKTEFRGDQTLDYAWSMIFSENRSPPGSSPGQAFSGSCS